MSASWEQYLRRVMSGAETGASAAALRAGLRAAEPFYSALMRGRNLLYDRGIFAVHPLGRPAVSIGNITAGGTGKTPVARWLTERLRDEGALPAILLRGYKVLEGRLSDEAEMLDRLLNGGSSPAVIIHADPDRLAAARLVLSRHPEVELFILDDAFQHRRAARDFDLVLIDATAPFGYGHVHPRGLLREPLRGLRRADAVLITRAAQASESTIANIEQEIRRHNPDAPVYHAEPVPAGLRRFGEDGGGGNLVTDLHQLREHRFFAFSGIGNPMSLHHQLHALPGRYMGHRWFDDHHHYMADDIADLRREALAAGADLLLTTEKDWVKIAPFAETRTGEPPIARLELALRFGEGDDSRLLDQLRRRLALRPRLHHPEAQRHQAKDDSD